MMRYMLGLMHDDSTGMRDGHSSGMPGSCCHPEVRHTLGLCSEGRVTLAGYENRYAVCLRSFLKMLLCTASAGEHERACELPAWIGC
eukprot:scaffold244046_cov14-Tisochrysis_lutea.AAC.1